MSDQPDYEVRTVTIPESSGTVVVYQHFYVTGHVDIILILNG